jgi:hypothetical protein
VEAANVVVALAAAARAEALRRSSFAETDPAEHLVAREDREVLVAASDPSATATSALASKCGSARTTC